MTHERACVIVGASLAGAKAAETLRSEGFDGRVVLVGEEDVRPYERPPLSKGLLRGESQFDDAAVHPADFYDEHDIELVLSTRVTEIRPAERTIVFGGGSLAYDRLLLATGSSVRPLSVPGVDKEGVAYLRSFEDARALRAAIDRSSKVVVIGAGWIGSEVAASARQMGRDVALVEAASVPLERVLGSEVGGMFAALHRDNGVELHMGVGVESIRGGSSFEAVRLANGEEIYGDLLVVGVGVRPRTELAEAAGLRVDDGVVVDANLATSDEAIFAAGDVANAWSPLLARSIRLEHWSAALNQGPVAARNMLGRQVTYDKVPYFFSDQYDLGMEYSGDAREWDEIVYRGDPDGREVIVFWCSQGRVVAGMNVNVWDIADDIARLVASRQVIDLALLRDPEIELGRLIERSGRP